MPLPFLSRLARLVVVGSLAVGSLFAGVSCARSGSSEPEVDNLNLLDPDAGGARGQNACVETQCPPPYATCPGEPGLCTTNLSNDVDHCGSCASPCPANAPNASFVCSEGQCRMVCDPLTADCNKAPADGCETPIESDPANCGACGNACKEGVICWRGACGCPNGYTACGLECKKLDSDGLNCGSCGNACHAPADDADPAWVCGAGVTPANTKWDCLSSACALSCKPGFGNCNTDFCGDGCEISLLTDAENCGSCGHKCDAGQTCDGGTCLCPAGTTNCQGNCVDIARDPRNCGMCSRRCPGPSAANTRKVVTGGPACEDGECAYVCVPGYADCDGKVSNGCEVNLQSDPLHCGACATQCNVAAGQPCVAGKCLTRECDAGVVF